ncbi:hypothetical protein QR685DRAFT_581951 [Neurospora intermedia]|uniref:Transmembrane protein n=1 Tax=Neurospora intermedia TaxID=5142 RepID=A0ABR3CZL4_NEUIN
MDLTFHLLSRTMFNSVGPSWTSLVPVGHNPFTSQVQVQRPDIVLFNLITGVLTLLPFLHFLILLITLFVNKSPGPSTKSSTSSSSSCTSLSSCASSSSCSTRSSFSASLRFLPSGLFFSSSSSGRLPGLPTPTAFSRVSSLWSTASSQAFSLCFMSLIDCSANCLSMYVLPANSLVTNVSLRPAIAFSKSLLDTNSSSDSVSVKLICLSWKSRLPSRFCSLSLFSSSSLFFLSSSSSLFFSSSSLFFSLSSLFFSSSNCFLCFLRSLSFCLLKLRASSSSPLSSKPKTLESALGNLVGVLATQFAFGV